MSGLQAARPDRSRDLDRFRNPSLAQLGMPLIALLAIEFVFGMTLNLYTTLPTGGGALAILESSPILIVHFIVALLLLGILARALLVASRMPDRRALGVVGPGFASGLVAFFGGTAFTFGGENPSASFAMALGFLGVFVAAGMMVAWGRSRDNRRQDPAQERIPDPVPGGTQ